MRAEDESARTYRTPALETGPGDASERKSGKDRAETAGLRRPIIPEKPEP